MEWQWTGLDKGSLEHGNEICSSFKSNEVIQIKSNRKSRNKSEKFSKKESPEIQGVTALLWKPRVPRQLTPPPWPRPRVVFQPRHWPSPLNRACPGLPKHPQLLHTP